MSDNQNKKPKKKKLTKGRVRKTVKNAGECVGVVKWFNPLFGYGFITVDAPPPSEVGDTENSIEAFVHYTDIEMDFEFKLLESGQLVRFDLIETNKGWSAEKVRFY